MKECQRNKPVRCGATLIEVVIAVGVLAVTIPMIFGALAEAARIGMASETETRCIWMVPACMDEIHASRDGRPRYFTATIAGEAFPPPGEVWALGFSSEGRPLGRLSREEYETGVETLVSDRVRYVARMSAAVPEQVRESESVPMLRIRISIEYPAGAPLPKRSKLEFFSRIP